MTVSDPELLQDLREGTLWLTFNRPESRNALTFSMYNALAEICRTVPTDGSVKAIVISGAGGKAFAAGTDMSQFRAFEKHQDALNYEEQIEFVLNAVERCPIPTIAAINGACTGGGASIAGVCDLRIAAANLQFGFPIARTLGNCLAARNLARLCGLIGPGRVRELIFTARLMQAEEAHAVGLVSEILKDEQALMGRAEELAILVGSMAPLTLRATKEAMRRNHTTLLVDDDDLITMCYMSDDFRNGIEAFLGKRKPEWKGK